MSRARPLLTAALAAWVVVPLAAQEPDTIPQDTSEQQEAAPPPEPTYAPPRFALSLNVGTLGFSTLQSQPVTATRINAAGEALDSTVLNRAVDSDRGFQLGASAVLSLDHAWALRLGLTLGRATIRPEYQGDAALFAATAARLAATEVTDVTLLGLEAALRMRIPSTRRVQPYLELGGSVTRWRGGTGEAGTPVLGEGVHRMGGLAAAGLDIPVTDRLAARLQATTRVFRTPVDPAPAGTAGPATSTMTLHFARPETDPFADSLQELTTTLRLELGISLGLGGPVEAPARPAAPAASPSPTGR